jgi:propanol-preferring alcohol dehydrogenase
MKAAVLHEFKRPLKLEEVPPPNLKQDEVLIQVEACGVCHSDVHLADGDWPQLAAATKIPLILGHEIAGRVVERGEAVHEIQIGERVGVPWIHWTCGECEFCREGNENLCARQRITGVTVDGGFATLVKAPASHVVKIPDRLSAVAAAPLFCAGVTVYRALRHARISPGQRLAVFGIGGLGHLAVQMGKELGARVIAVDVSEAKLNLAKSLGAELGLDASSAHVAKELRAQGGVHVALVTSAARPAYESAFSCLRTTGTLLVVGLPAENICFPPILMAAGEICIRASAVGTRQDLREVLALAAAGKLRCATTTHALEEVNSVLDRLRRGEISGRAVLTTNSTPR